MLKAKVQQLAKSFKKNTIAIRRHLHQHPELSYQEHKTCQYIQKQLTNIGITDWEVRGKTGIVAHIKGKHPSKALFALRADIDALPIQEQNAVDYASKNDGVMHACGHDVHTSSLLGAAYILHSLRAEWEGTIRLIFQPAEEVSPGGATVMIANGALENPTPKGIVGQHTDPELEVGTIGLCNGICMASADELYFTVRGKGGHGARPHQCVDTILVASHLVVALQQLISRNADPFKPSVLTIGKIYSEGGATNIIPNEVKMMGTFRAFDEEWRAEGHQKIMHLAQQLCASMGASCEVNIIKGAPFVKNDELQTSRIWKAAEDYLGKENVLKIPPRTGAEDFAHYSHLIPATFYRLGAKNPNGTGLHTPTFDIDEDAIETSIGLMAWLAIQEVMQ